MFTGIVTDVGEVLAAVDRSSGKRFRIATSYDAQGIAIGASIACAGCCLTVVDKGRNPSSDKPFWFEVEVSTESLERTTARSWAPGTRLNLERALRVGDELGGHMVSGHVDGTARIVAREDDADMAVLWFEIPQELARFVAQKGSVALDGTSLTVNRVEGNRFSVMIIPHTQAVTTWDRVAAGDLVNFEVDLMARYVARLGE
jgi:riboflavin synthase